MILHDVKQGSPEWHALRKGKMTASHACEIGNNGKGLETYILTILSEQLSSADEEGYTNENMERGQELEEQARSVYELENDVEVKQVGFIEYSPYVGCSPDGLVGEDGGIEIKCPNDLNYFKMLIGGEIDSKYVWQVQMNLLITGREWWDLVTYNPNFEKNMLVTRILPDKEAREALLSGFAAGQVRIEQLKSKLNF